MTTYVYFSWVFGTLILAFECWRFARERRVDPLSFISLMFLGVFVIAPNIIAVTPPSSRFYERFLWLAALPEDWQIYVEAAFVITFGYAGIVGGYYFQFAPPSGELRPVQSPRRLMILGTVFLVIGGASFLVFAEIVVGGIAKTLTVAPILRADPLSLGYHPLLFIKRFTVFSLPAAFFFIQSLSYARIWQEKIIIIGLISVSLMVSLAALYLDGGRLNLIFYAMIFLVPFMMKNVRMAVILIMAAILLSFFVVLFLHDFVQKLTSTDQILEHIELPNRSPMDRIKEIFLEFSFPLSDILSALRNVPETIPFRYFADFPLVAPRFLPGGIFSQNLPPQIGDISTDALIGAVPWGIPVDLLSMGWFSLGAPGVVILAILYGRLARVIDRALPQRICYGADMVRSCWMMMAGFVVMYGDPRWLLIEQLHWEAALLTYLLFCTRWHPFKPSLID
ncbi:MAG TPA: hypothetical protein VKT70_14500 [Stellaceae bacterium]|nr:hypothetical protein [Stellaceae bacterium]